MLRITLSALTLACLLLVPSAASDTASGTSSTGDVDTYGVTLPLPSDSCTVDPLSFDCLAQACPHDIYQFRVRLTLLDPSPGDAVAVVQAADLPYVRDGLHITDVPAAIATYENPSVQMNVQLGGCNRGTTVAVAGLMVQGDVSYSLTY